MVFFLKIRDFFPFILVDSFLWEYKNYRNMLITILKYKYLFFHSAFLCFFTSLLFSCTTSPVEQTQKREEVPVITEEHTKVQIEDQIEDPLEDQLTEEEKLRRDLIGIYKDMDDSSKALESFEKSDINSLNPELRLVYAILLYNENRIDEARDELNTLLDEHPSMAEAWFNLALLENMISDESARDKALEEALKLNPNMIDALTLQGDIAANKSDWTLAESSYKKALEQNPESLGSLVGLAWVHAKNNRTESSLPLLDKAVELAPDFVYARVDRARVHVYLENYIEAENDLSVAIEEEPDVPWHYLDRARIRFRYFHNFEGAISDLKYVEKLMPNNFFAMVYLAGIYDEQKKFDLAYKYYSKVVELQPTYIWAYMPMGKLSWMKGDYETAARFFEKTVNEEPTEFSFQLMHALSLLRSNKKREAKVLLEKTLKNYKPSESIYEVIRFCIERNSDFHVISRLNREEDKTLKDRLWFYLASIYEFEGNENSAKAAYGRIATLNGHMEYDMAWATMHGMGNSHD